MNSKSISEKHIVATHLEGKLAESSSSCSRISEVAIPTTRAYGDLCASWLSTRKQPSAPRGDHTFEDVSRTVTNRRNSFSSRTITSATPPTKVEVYASPRITENNVSSSRRTLPIDSMQNVRIISEEKTTALGRLMVKIHFIIHKILGGLYTKWHQIEDTNNIFVRTVQQASQPVVSSIAAPPPEELVRSAPAILQTQAQALSPQERIQVKLEAMRLSSYHITDLKTKQTDLRNQLAIAEKPYSDAEKKLGAMPRDEHVLGENIKSLFTRLSELHEVYLAELRAKAALDKKTQELREAQDALTQASQKEWTTWLVGDSDLQLAISQAQMHQSHAEGLHGIAAAKYKEVAARYQKEFQLFVTTYLQGSVRDREQTDKTIGFFTTAGQKVQKQASAFIEILQLMPHDPEKFREKIYAIVDKREDGSLPESILKKLREEPLLTAVNRPPEGLEKALTICEKGFDELLKRMRNFGINDCEGMREAINTEIAELNLIRRGQSRDPTITQLNDKISDVNSEISTKTDEFKAAIASIIRLKHEAGEAISVESIKNDLAKIELLNNVLTESDLDSCIRLAILGPQQ